MIVTYLFRSPGTGYSIEGVFNSLLPEIKRQPDVLPMAISLPFISQGLRSVWRNLRFVARLKANVVHVTGDVHYAVLALPRARTILTIHDCITLKNNHNRPLRYAIFWLLWYYLPIRQAAVVTVVSEKTRQELIQYVGPIARKAIVVSNSYDSALAYQPASVQNEPPVLLQIGTAPHKNLARLLAAIEGIRCRLIIIGPLTEILIDNLKQRRIDYRNYVNLDRTDVVQGYIDCDIVTFVSTYEGFGMPILEANAIGRPVITSDVSPMREVAGGAAHLVDPTDVAAIRQGVLQLIHDATYRQRLVNAGLKNARRYTTKAIAEQYVGLYKQLDQRKLSTQSVS
ncbi:glycosyltransferase family 4 protein [Spirosoma validum]|uniref:Glycosyltransferase family 4 protein n=1 Tax=Spirosoma validum TaxID=2771355 RepID=A0A927AX75_9BACT|nr:glycosyltransferase family 1 protein [Spirosoma validum]MBD2751377.1 glycosyltransferase family 4 protein [Spirosoma validum]